MQTENGFKRTVYRKKTFSGAYTAWDSFFWTHKAKGSCNKIAGVQSKKNCSDEYPEAEINTVKSILINVAILNMSWLGT